MINEFELSWVSGLRSYVGLDFKDNLEEEFQASKFFKYAKIHFECGLGDTVKIKFMDFLKATSNRELRKEMEARFLNPKYCEVFEYIEPGPKDYFIKGFLNYDEVFPIRIVDEEARYKIGDSSLELAVRHFPYPPEYYLFFLPRVQEDRTYGITDYSELGLGVKGFGLCYSDRTTGEEKFFILNFIEQLESKFPQLLQSVQSVPTNIALETYYRTRLKNLLYLHVRGLALCQNGIEERWARMNMKYKYKTWVS